MSATNPTGKRKRSDEHDKERGMIWANAYGDALGAPYEMRGCRVTFDGKMEHVIERFNRYQKTWKRSDVGAVTDDCQMTIALLRVLSKGWTRERAILAYQLWASYCPFLGYTTKALFKGPKGKEGTVQRYESRRSKALEGTLKTMFRNRQTGEYTKLTDVQSNGSLMRAAPFALISGTDFIDDCNLSNPNDVNRQASTLYIHVLRHLLNDGSPEEALQWMQDNATESCLVFAVTETERDVTPSKGWTAHAIFCVARVLRHAKTMTFHESMCDIVSLGGDTDTNAAIAGAVLGAYRGFQDMVSDPVVATNIELIRNATGGDYVVPDDYSPRHIDELIETVLLHQK